MSLAGGVRRPQGLRLTAPDFKQAALLKGCDPPAHRLFVFEFTSEFRARSRHGIAR
jgi:hypothetical protein